VVVLAMVSPTAAVAKPGYFVSGGGFRSIIRLHGSHGYRIEVESYNGHSVSLTARKGRAQGIYLFQGEQMANGGIEGKFPGRARIAVRFVPRGRPQLKRPAGNCEGRAAVAQPGVFVGGVWFRGEGGFTEVDTRAARGMVVRSFKQVCRNGPAEGPGGPEIRWASLTAGRTQGSSLLHFVAGRFEANSPRFRRIDRSLFSASITNLRGRDSSTRSVSAVAPASAFATDPSSGIRSATLTPPAPFSGTGSLAWEPGSAATWTGTLAAEIPGAGAVRLTGDGFEPMLCIGRHCTEAQKQSQASGSHSQPFAETRLSLSR
jgi:hypothetical protein